MKLTAENMAIRREEMLRAAFRLFSERNIDSVSMEDVAAETGYTSRSLYRYFNTKDELVVAVAASAFGNFFTLNGARQRDPALTTAAEDYAFFLDSFLMLYRERADLLRFNQIFNVFVRAEHIGAREMQPFRAVIDRLRTWFHAIYAKADGTLCAQFSEEEIFSTTLHLMLAAVTRYAVGLVYRGDTEPETELLTLRDMLLRQYTVTPSEQCE